jgi:hypothetical protein
MRARRSLPPDGQTAALSCCCLSICSLVFLRRPEEGRGRNSGLGRRLVAAFTSEAVSRPHHRAGLVPPAPASSTGFPAVACRHARLGSARIRASRSATGPGVNGVFLLLPAAPTRKSREVSLSGPHVCRGRGAV